MKESQSIFVITAVCPDAVGIIAAISGFVAKEGGWISEAGFHSETEPARFFVRQEIVASSLPYGIETLRQRFAPIAEQFQMTWRINEKQQKKRVLLLVSKQGHCLYDLLGRWQSGDLPFELPRVISNHPDFAALVERHGVPFTHIPIAREAEAKAEAFAQLREAIDAEKPDVIVLARFMQILPAALCERYHGRIINIHHSFLPSFIGADPYRQAFTRGVKLIGASCHYVTPELDQGPIIEQDIVRIDHSDRPEDLISYGKDIEKTVLARGLRFHLEDRVLIHGNKTIVFR